MSLSAAFGTLRRGKTWTNPFTGTFTLESIVVVVVVVVIVFVINFLFIFVHISLCRGWGGFGAVEDHVHCRNIQEGVYY